MGDTTVLGAARAYARRDPVNGAKALREVEPRPVHPLAAFAVAAWVTLTLTAGAGFEGRAAISLHDIDAYGRVYGTPLAGREVAIVLAMDAAARGEAKRQQELEAKAKADEAKAARGLA